MIAGLNEPSEWEANEIRRLGICTATAEALIRDGSEPVLHWLRATGAKRLAIHFDLDVLDPALFRSLLFARASDPPGTWDGVAQGRLTIPQIVQLLGDASGIADVVGIGIYRASSMGRDRSQDHAGKAAAYRHGRSSTPKRRTGVRQPSRSGAKGLIPSTG